MTGPVALFHFGKLLTPIFHGGAERPVIGDYHENRQILVAEQFMQQHEGRHLPFAVHVPKVEQYEASAQIGEPNRFTEEPRVGLLELVRIGKNDFYDIEKSRARLRGERPVPEVRRGRPRKSR